MNARLFFWSLASALAGFLFGFDTVVISGAEMTIQSLWGLSPTIHGLAMGAALWGTVLGSFIGSWPTDRLGRKKTLLCIGVLFLVGSLWSALAHEVISFMIARFLGGIAIAEIFPNEFRALGQSLGSFTHWIFAALLTTFFPEMVASLSAGYIFLFFCFMMVLQLAWVRLMVPETRGRSLEEIQRDLNQRA